MTYKYEFTLSIGFAKDTRRKVVEYDEEPSPDELDQDWEDWSRNHIEGGYSQLDESSN